MQFASLALKAAACGHGCHLIGSRVGDPPLHKQWLMAVVVAVSVRWELWGGFSRCSPGMNPPAQVSWHPSASYAPSLSPVIGPVISNSVDPKEKEKHLVDKNRRKPKRTYHRTALWMKHHFMFVSKGRWLWNHKSSESLKVRVTYKCM